MSRLPTRPTLIAERTPWPASKNQWTQPVAALSEYTLPPQLPTNTRPPAIVDCAYDCRSPGNANAHFSFSLGTSVAVRPAAAPSWNRVLLVFCPHPVHRGPALGLNASVAPVLSAFAEASADRRSSPPASGGWSDRPAVHIAAAAGVVTRGLPTGLPVRNSAIARRSAAVRLFAMVIIDPVSMAASTRS